jgi:hypothetical protein
LARERHPGVVHGGHLGRQHRFDLIARLDALVGG